jgi:hypothetical protein
MRHSFAPRLLYFRIGLFWSVPPRRDQQQIGPHAPPYSPACERQSSSTEGFLSLDDKLIRRYE